MADATSLAKINVVQVREDPYGELKLPLPPPPPPPVQPSPRHPPPARKQRVSLPVSRVKTIMKTNVKSSQQNLNISQDSVLVLSRATELFIAQLAKEASKVAEEGNNREVVYNHLSSAVRKNESQMKFLYDLLPKKVLAREFLATLRSSDSTATDQSSNNS